MLGEKFGESVGRVVGTRVIPDLEKGGVRIETSVMASSKIYGIDAQEVATFWAAMQPSGWLYGEGHGVLMTKDGESVTWKGHGIGKPTGKGLGASYRASVTFQTLSQKLAKLHGVLGVIEFEVDEQGNTKGQVWEWR